MLWQVANNHVQTSASAAGRDHQGTESLAVLQALRTPGFGTGFASQPEGTN